MRYLTSLLLIYLSSCAAISYAQLYRGTAITARLTSYEFDGRKDSIFIFDDLQTQKFIEARNITNDTTSFIWSVYDTTLQIFNQVDIVRGDTMSTLEISGNTGYSVRMFDGTNDTTFYCWVFNVDYKVQITSGIWEEHEDYSDTIKLVDSLMKTCNEIREIQARIYPPEEEFVYYKWGEDTTYYLGWNYVFVNNFWSADTIENPTNDEINIITPFSQLGDSIKVSVTNPAWEDIWIYFKPVDNFGIQRGDSIFYETIIPHADYVFQYLKLDNYDYYPVDTTENGFENYSEVYGKDYDAISAPAKFLFTDKSKNAVEVSIDYGDGITELLLDSVVHEYQLPGTYEPKLYAINEVSFLYDVCIDTFPKTTEEYTDTIGGNEYPIEIDEAQLTATASLPNVFSVDGSNYNYFRFIGDVSISDFHISIYNRFGKEVYEYEGNIRNWTGWDGTYKNSGKYVRTGVYFYVVRNFTMLPDYETGRVPNLFNDRATDENNSETQKRTNSYKAAGNSSNNSSSGSGSSGNVKDNTLLKGFVHVYSEGSE